MKKRNLLSAVLLFALLGASAKADIINGHAEVQGADLKLGLNDGRDKGAKPHQRALVHLTEDRLIMNYDGDFEGGTVVQGSKFSVDGVFGVGTHFPKAALQANSYGAFDEYAGWANFGSNLFYSENGWDRIDPSKGGVNLHMASTETSGGVEFRFYHSSTSGARRNIAYIGTSFNYFEQEVGIGTTTPDYKLDVNGTMRAKEVIVASNWSDFVFEDGYDLPSLSEVESHIAEHGHLPDIPSAAHIQENGLAVAEAQTLMMQKIEELTLYVIDLKKENLAQQSRIEELEAKLIK